MLGEREFDYRIKKNDNNIIMISYKICLLLTAYVRILLLYYYIIYVLCFFDKSEMKMLIKLNLIRII